MTAKPKAWPDFSRWRKPPECAWNVTSPGRGGGTPPPSQRPRPGWIRAIRLCKSYYTDLINAKGDVHLRGGGSADIDAPAAVTLADKVTADPPNANVVKL